MYSFAEFWKANDPGGGSGGAKDADAPDPAAAAAGERAEAGILESPFVPWVADLDASDCLRLDVQIAREIARWEAARLVIRASPEGRTYQVGPKCHDQE